MNYIKLISLTKSEAVVLLATLLIAVSLIGGSRLLRLENPQSIYSDTPVEFYLEEPINLERLSTMLADSGVIDDREEILWAGKLLGWRNFQKGRYTVDQGHSYSDFLSKLARGIQDPVSITILPGSSEERLADRISDQMEFDSTAFHQAINDTTLLQELGIDRKDLIGRMLPDTYSIYWTAPPDRLLRRIIKEFDSRVYEPNRERLRELDITVDEAVTLASIIEWEATLSDEKKKISGLYWNRLDRGMRLQADPTINYVVDERRRLLYKDYQIEHPYNTYIHDGLPPGPITNPDISSIEAALYPSDHNYLYMVASPEGKHIFSETFEEHRRRSAEWRKWIEEQYRLKREAERQEENNRS